MVLLLSPYSWRFSVGSSLISYGPLDTPPGSSRCPNGIARCTKVHLEVSQTHKSASGGEPDAQKCIWRCTKCIWRCPNVSSRCPDGSPDCPGALSQGGKICEGRACKSHEYGDSGPLSSTQGNLLTNVCGEPAAHKVGTHTKSGYNGQLRANVQRS